MKKLILRLTNGFLWQGYLLGVLTKRCFRLLSQERCTRITYFNYVQFEGRNEGNPNPTQQSARGNFSANVQTRDQDHCHTPLVDLLMRLGRKLELKERSQ